jgi:hypothetical protein
VEEDRDADSEHGLENPPARVHVSLRVQAECRALEERKSFMTPAGESHLLLLLVPFLALNQRVDHALLYDVACDGPGVLQARRAGEEEESLRGAVPCRGRRRT